MTIFHSTNTSAEDVFFHLKKMAQTFDFNDGFKLVYDRWDRIANSKVMFLSLNPGRAPKGVSLEDVYDEKGNTYVAELEISKSPINRQFIDIFKLLGIDLEAVLAGVYIPFRSNRLKDLTKEQKEAALKFARQFWGPLVKDKALVICCGADVFKEIHEQLFADEMVEIIASGWGKTSIKRIVRPNGQMVIGLPHLSTYKLLSNNSCRDVLLKAIKYRELNSTHLKQY